MRVFETLGEVKRYTKPSDPLSAAVTATRPLNQLAESDVTRPSCAEASAQGLSRAQRLESIASV